MENALKICNSVERLLVLLSGILLVFMFSTSDTALYQLALRDILVLGEDGAANLSKFITSNWLVKRRSEDKILPIYQESNKTLMRFAVVLRESMDELGVQIDKKNVFETSIFRPGQYVRLGGWERPDLFIALPPVDRPTVRRMLHYLDRDSLEGTILVLPSFAIWFYPHVKHAARQKGIKLTGTKLVEVRLVSKEIGKGRIERIERRPRQETPFGLFRLHFDKGTSEDDPLIELDIKVPMNRTSFLIEANEWSQLKSQWYISKGFDPNPYVSAKSPYSHLRMLESEIGNMKLGDAAKWLKSKLSYEKTSMNFLGLGISVDRNLLSTIGPITLAILMLGLISAMRHIATVAETIEFKHYNFYWGIISPSRTAKVTSLISISLIPGATCIGFSFYSNGNVVILIPSILGALIAIAVFLIAIRLPSKLPSAN